ncbi:MAG: hypothetical protein M3R25_06230 [Bacteroidota bacterium]|nr:hypothetical protein [Bacteroidota bacterium]
MKGRLRPIMVLFFTLVLTIGIPACEGPDYAAIRGIHRLDFLDPATNLLLDDPVTVVTDSMVLVITPDIEYFSENTFDGTISEAWAFSPGDPLLANEITDIRVFADNPIYGVPAGDNIASKLEYGGYREEKLTLNEFLDLLPKKGDDFSYGLYLYLFFNSRPAIPDEYTFRVELEDNNGYIFRAISSPLTWQ